LHYNSISSMNKTTQLRLIGLISMTAEQLTPITFTKDSILYSLLLQKLERFERWRNTRKISRQDFEIHLNKSEELVNAYLEVYNKTATFYRCAILYGQIQFDYYVMMRRNRIVLFFFHVNKT